MYGSRDINRHDKDFADRNKRKTIYASYIVNIQINGNRKDIRQSLI